MGRRTPERMFDITGLNQWQRDQLIYEMWRRRVPYRKIAARVGVSLGAVQGSIRRTREKLAAGERPW